MSGLSYQNGGVEFKTELHTKTGPDRTLLVSGEHLAHHPCTRSAHHPRTHRMHAVCVLRAHLCADWGSTMSKFITIEACTDGTLTRANARALNRVLGTAFSGSTLVADAEAACAQAGVQVRVVAAASLSGRDKAAHTREVSRSARAQARRVARKTTAAAAA